ncbi:MAG: FAA hydrolase family protein [Planctomycetota bacterium]|nr:MAG: FAA hydrolase family protein [Planctomycetota bacterium]
MRLVTMIAPDHSQRCGLLLGEHVVAIDEVAPDLGALSVRELLRSGRLRELAARCALIRPDMGRPLSSVHLGPPIPDPSKIIAVGLNYRGHAEEQGKPWPEAPMLFSIAPSALCGPRDAIVLPVDSSAVDFEVELVAVIGQRCKGVSRDQAMGVIAGYLVANDVSERRWQKQDGQFYRAKSADSFFPCGPALVTADEVADYRELLLTTTINDQEYQRALASDLIHDLPALISYISRDQTLEPGDLISTGTPAGVGCYRQPPRFLQAGDLVCCAIDGLGSLENPVRAGAAHP